TIKFGKTWTRLADESQVEGFALSVIQDPVEPNLLFLGTDAGLYISFNKGVKWHHWNENFPAVQVADMKIQPDAGDLVLATFGRSMWVLDNIRPLRTLAEKGTGILDSAFLAFETADAYIAANTSYQGTRFIAQGEFVGENKSVDQASTYLWIKPEVKKDDSKNEKNKQKAEKNDK